MTHDLSLAPLHAVIEEAGAIFKEMLGGVLSSGGLTREQYVRYLQMQYHLTREVQRYFLVAAAHPAMAGKRAFRNFLYNFALEEEPHFGIAESDLSALGESVGDCPLDVKLWHAYFSKVVVERPYSRLGAAAVLESIGSIASEIIKPLLKDARFLNERNTRFVVIHMHEVLPHGAQVLLEIRNSEPAAGEIADLTHGAREGAVLYLRMAAWALGTDGLQNRLIGA